MCIRIIMHCRRSFFNWKSWRKLHPNWKESVSVNQYPSLYMVQVPFIPPSPSNFFMTYLLQHLCLWRMSYRAWWMMVWWTLIVLEHQTTSGPSPARHPIRCHIPLPHVPHVVLSIQCVALLLSEKTKAGGLERTTGREWEEETVTRRASQNCFCW